MSKSLIRIAFRQIIDSTSAGIVERKIFRDTWEEFRMQVQAYNREGKFQTLREVIADNPKANSLHYKVGFAMGLYVNEFNGIIPGLYDTLGKQMIPFGDFEFEMVESHVSKKELHKVAITYHTDSLTLFATLGELMVVGLGNQIDCVQPVQTFLVKMQPNLSVTSWQDFTAESLRKVGS